MSTAVLTSSRAAAEVERLLDELRRRIGEDDAETDRLRWQLAEAVKADLARRAA